ncbi:MAG: hypothetical protein AB7E24_05320 [Novosphingobium sp.]
MTHSLLILAALSLSATLFSPSARADAVLARFSGVWKGDGWAVRSEGEPRQAIRCRVVMRYSEAIGKLAFSGRCGGGGDTASFSGDLVNSTGSTYRGEWTVSGSDARDLLIGEASGPNMTFHLGGTGRSNYEGTMRWSLRDGGLTINSAVARNGRQSRSVMKLARTD